jgi:hypothetical protein
LNSIVLSLDHSLTLSDDALFRELDREGVILDLASGRYFGVDRVGARIWQLLGRPATLRQVYAQLLEEFDVAPEILEQDLVEFAGQLVSRGLASAVVDP